jgi:hypothetical protein
MTRLVFSVKRMLHKKNKGNFFCSTVFICSNFTNMSKPAKATVFMFRNVQRRTRKKTCCFAYCFLSLSVYKVRGQQEAKLDTQEMWLQGGGRRQNPPGGYEPNIFFPQQITTKHKTTKSRYNNY